MKIITRLTEETSSSRLAGAYLVRMTKEEIEHIIGKDVSNDSMPMNVTIEVHERWYLLRTIVEKLPDLQTRYDNMLKELQAFGAKMNILQAFPSSPPRKTKEK